MNEIVRIVLDELASRGRQRGFLIMTEVQQELEDVDVLLRMQIHHFFDHYKDLEAGKWVNILGWGDADAARKEILDSVERYNTLPEKPENW